MTNNYQSKYWGLIYDQMMETDLAGWLEDNREFYASRLKVIEGPILECACGTGLIMQHLLERGLDLLGFDASESMLGAYRKKAPEVAPRLSRQLLESFRYARQFEAVIIPTNSFSMLTTREAQLATLQNIARHLAPGGVLLMDIRLSDRAQLETDADGIEGRWHEFTHPETGGVIRQRIISHPHDFEHHIYRDLCVIEYAEDTEQFPMESRWIFRTEFEQLVSEAGFAVLGFKSGDWGSYWTLGAQ